MMSEALGLVLLFLLGSAFTFFVFFVGVKQGESFGYIKRVIEETAENNYNEDEE